MKANISCGAHLQLITRLDRGGVEQDTKQTSETPIVYGDKSIKHMIAELVASRARADSATADQ